MRGEGYVELSSRNSQTRHHFGRIAGFKSLRFVIVPCQPHRVDLKELGAEGLSAQLAGGFCAISSGA